jgi:hypothetical protein
MRCVCLRPNDRLNARGSRGPAHVLHPLDRRDAVLTINEHAVEIEPADEFRQRWARVVGVDDDDNLSTLHLVLEGIGHGAPSRGRPIWRRRGARAAEEWPRRVAGADRSGRDWRHEGFEFSAGPNVLSAFHSDE